MSKPIFLIQCDRSLPPEHNERLMEKLQVRMPDWHILVASTLQPGEPAKFSAYTVKDADDIEIEKLKELVSKELSSSYYS
jgi:hypothetical protein